MDSGVDQHHHSHNVGFKQEDEQNHDHEKKSVLKKVKAKAKKIKDTIKKHSHHDHDHDHDHVPDDHDLDEEDDEDEDMAENSEVRGAPIYDSTAPRTAIPSEQVHDHHHQEPKVVVVSTGMGTDQTVANDSATRTFTGDSVNTGQRNVNLQRPKVLEEDPAAPRTRHPHTVSNYESKVTDPTGEGGAEIQVGPVLISFAEMNVHDGTKSYPEPHVHSSATNQYHSGVPIMYEEHKQYESKNKPSNQNAGCTDKISSATSAAVDKAVGAKNAVASELGYDDNKHNRDYENEQIHGRNQSSYTDKVSSATSVVADKAAAAKNAVTSKLGYGDNKDGREIEKEGQSSYTEKISSAPSVMADKAVSAKNVVASKLGYGDNKVDNEKDTSQSSYTDKISYATSAIADKAVSAKNAVTSKLGYGGENRTDRDNEKETNQSSYTQKLSSAPYAIADKAAAAKNVITSKFGYGGENRSDRVDEKETSPGEKQSSYTEKLSSATSAIADKAVSAKKAVTSKLGYGGGGDHVNETDKGVSVKDYVSEKLRPGDEDRALSDVISNALRKRGGGGGEAADAAAAETAKESGGGHRGGRKVTDVISDVIHDRDEVMVETEHRPLGKVTESEEVKRRLGGETESEKRYEEIYENSSGKGVVDKIKDAAGSWFGTSSQDTGKVGEDKRKLQESSN